MITDESKCIKLYYANRKGWNILKNTSGNTFHDIVNKGARYLISNSKVLENREGIKDRIRLVLKYYSFNIYEIIDEEDQMLSK